MGECVGTYIIWGGTQTNVNYWRLIFYKLRSTVLYKVGIPYLNLMFFYLNSWIQFNVVFYWVYDPGFSSDPPHRAASITRTHNYIYLYIFASK